MRDPHPPSRSYGRIRRRTVGSSHSLTPLTVLRPGFLRVTVVLGQTVFCGGRWGEGCPVHSSTCWAMPRFYLLGASRCDNQKYFQTWQLSPGGEQCASCTRGPPCGGLSARGFQPQPHKRLTWNSLKNPHLSLSSPQTSSVCLSGGATSAKL